MDSAIAKINLAAGFDGDTGHGGDEGGCQVAAIIVVGGDLVGDDVGQVEDGAAQQETKVGQDEAGDQTGESFFDFVGFDIES